MSSVCHSYVLACHPYVTRMYLYVIRMSLVCTRMSSVCHSYELVRHPYVTRIWFYHEPLKSVKIKLKTSGVSIINFNVQLCCDTTSSASLLMYMFVTGLKTFNSIVMTTLFVTLIKMVAFYRGALLILL